MNTSSGGVGSDSHSARPAHQLKKNCAICIREIPVLSFSYKMNFLKNEYPDGNLFLNNHWTMPGKNPNQNFGGALRNFF